MQYNYSKEIDLGFYDAVEITRDELKKQGFGVLTEIDVKSTLKLKLNADYDNYVILGACNPHFAYKALQTEKEIGLFLPCNVIVYSEGDKTFVSAINPVGAMLIVDNSRLKEIAETVKVKLETVIDSIGNNAELKKVDLKKHWENVFNTKNSDELSWHQEYPKTSIDLISSSCENKDSCIIDVGGGDSNLAYNLLKLGFKNISVIDISLKALERSKQRIGDKAKLVKWIDSDIREFKTTERFDVWHDRALFHFLTSEEDIDKYVKLVGELINPGGYLIIATFSDKGPEKCSGLEVKRYTEKTIREYFKGFKYIKSFAEIHTTPFHAKQSFIWNVFKNQIN